MQTLALDWHRSSLCQTGECVEIAIFNDTVVMRSSAHPESGFPHPVALSHGRASPIDEQFSRRVTALFDRLTGADRETSSGDHHVAIVLPGRPETVETSVAS